MDFFPIFQGLKTEKVKKFMFENFLSKTIFKVKKIYGLEIFLT